MIALVTRPAAAEPTRDPAAAQLLFEKGKRALDDGNVDTACAYFAESLRLDFGVGTLFNLATCEERQGKVASAWQHLREGIDQLPPGDRRQAPAEEQARLLERRAPRLTVRLSPNAPADTRVFRDGVELSSVSLGTALPVDPGAHHVVVEAAGRSARAIDMTLREREAQEIVVEPGPLLDPSPGVMPERPPPLREVRPGSVLPKLGIAAAASGAAGVALGAITGTIALVRSDAVKEQCDVPSRLCSQDGLDALDATKTWGTVSTVAFVAGAALLTTGIVLLFFPRRAGNDPPSAVYRQGRRGFAGGN
jgi:hypothetical protein